MYQLKSVVQPNMPVTIERAKEHLHVEHDRDNTYITMLIQSAVSTCQHYSWRKFSPTTVTIEFPCSEELTFPDVVNAITSGTLFTTETPAGITLTAAMYRLRTVNDVSYIEKLDDWPSGTFDRLEFEYTTGYPDDELPTPLQSAVLLTLTDLYEDRGTKARTLPTTAENIIDNGYRRSWLK